MPQQHIDTIPIWEAYRQDCECPLCSMEARCENQFLDVALGGALMEPDTRIMTNEKGFCAQHLNKLYKRENRLGFALTLHTHLKDYMETLKKQTDLLQKELSAEEKKNLLSKTASGVTKNSPYYKQLDALALHLEERNGTCYICDRVKTTMDRYLETVLYMYRKDPEFKKVFLDSKGVCLQHYSALVIAARKHLIGESHLAFIRDLLMLQEKNLKRMEEELEWFTLKFDYRNQAKPWGNSKDAVERSLNKLQGRVFDAEQEKK